MPRCQAKLSIREERSKRRVTKRGLSVPILLMLLAASLLLSGLPIEEPSEGPGRGAGAGLVDKQSPYITEYELPIPSAAPMALALDGDGHLWIGMSNATSLMHLNTKTMEYEQFDLPLANGLRSIWDMEVDKDGNVWFTLSEENSVWMLNPRTGEFKRYQLPTPESFPMRLAIDMFGKIWVTELFGGKVAKIDPGSGRVSELAIPGDEPAPLGITIGPKGYVWVTERSYGRILRIDPSNDELEVVPTSKPLYTPIGIAVDGEGVVWFVEYVEGKGSIFSRLDPISGEITRYATSIVGGAPTLPMWIAIDDSGNIWINQHAGNKIAMFNPKEEVLLEYILPRGASRGASNTLQFSVESSDKVWFSEWTENKVGLIDVVDEPPFKLEVTPRRITVRPGEEVRLKLKISGRSDERLSLSISGTFSPSGKLADYVPGTPSRLMPPSGGSYSVNISLNVSEEVEEGDYTLTVSIADETFVYSVIVHLKVVDDLITIS